MDGMLSQDEINALLAGMDMSDSSTDTTASAEATEEELLSDLEKDAIGEVANISMGSSATTLYSLVNRKVNITTPNVSLARWENVIEDYQKPCVFIQIRYTQGLDGSNILILREQDVKVITDLMMGGDGSSNLADELSDLHLSAISEAMNQMMGAAATSLSTMLNKLIDISPPEATLVDLPTQQFGDEIADFLAGTFVKISFRMQIDELVDSTIIQLYPIDFAKSLCDIFLGGGNDSSNDNQSEPTVSDYTPPTLEASPSANQSSMGMGQTGTPQMNMGQMNMGQMGMPQMDMSQMNMGQMGMNQMGMNQMGMNPMMGMPQMNMGQMGMPQMGMNPMMGMPQMGITQDMNIQPAQFQTFQGDYSQIPGAENISIIRDVPLEVTVELGRTVKAIADILDFAPGTIIELDKLAGEPVDVLVNGKHVAKGEVVVVEENFGVRVTEIIK